MNLIFRDGAHHIARKPHRWFRYTGNELSVRKWAMTVQLREQSCPKKRNTDITRYLYTPRQNEFIIDQKSCGLRVV